MGKLSKSELVRKLAEKSFQECDLDNDGSIDAKELHVGLLLVYDKLNKSLPVYLKPPSHKQVRDLHMRHDFDSDGRLTFEEFHQCVRSVVGLNEATRFRDSLPAVVIGRMALKMAIFPLAALALREVIKEVAGKKASKRVPDPVLVFGVEGLYKLGRITFT